MTNDDKNRNMGETSFNWVKARARCSLWVEFALLQREAKENTDERRRLYKSDPPLETEFEFRETGPNKFLVMRSDPRKVIAFSLERDHIAVDDNEGNLSILNLTLNDEGECRFTIDGEGDFKRWQVLRRTLEDLFFAYTSDAQ